MKTGRYSLKGIVLVNILTFLTILGGLILGGIAGNFFLGEQGDRIGAAIGGIAAFIYTSKRRPWKNLIYTDSNGDSEDTHQRG